MHKRMTIVKITYVGSLTLQLQRCYASSVTVGTFNLVFGQRLSPHDGTLTVDDIDFKFGTEIYFG